MFLPLQNTVLEMIARGSPVGVTAQRLCLEAQALAPDCICSILTIDSAGRLQTLAAPDLPEPYCEAVNGVEVGPEAGSCGAAAHRRRDVVVTDIASDPLWADYKHIALPHGLVACWSSPIFGKDGKVIATFAFYFKTPRGPSDVERSIVDTCVNLCAIALERHEVEQENRRLAYFDSLTGLANRASYDLALAEADPGRPDAFALLLIDVDRLKLVNDTLGHAGGDDLLRDVAGRIALAATEATSCRAFRLGGDEFAAIITGPGASERLAPVAQSIFATMQRPSICGGYAIRPTVTIGGASLGADAPTVEAMRQNADFALYHAKEKNRGGFVRFSPRLGSTMTRRFQAIGKVREALEDGLVEAFYQPVVRLDTSEIIGVEALCRVWDQVGERMPPEEFQLAMTDATTGARLTERMLIRIARDVRHWLDAGVPFQHVGVNISTGDFQAGDLDQRIAVIFDRYDVPLRHVILEVTEMVYMGDSDLKVPEAVKALRARGLLVALDDFGTGYASLTHLLSFPVDIIKIDRSFVAALRPGAPSAAIVEGVVDIARKLGMRVVAEGVETAVQAKQLQALGCRLAQGYHYARPCSFEAATELMRERGQRPQKDAETAQSAA